MPDLLYFNPDPQIPDADLLGYGDLVYSNGVTNYLSGDPEMAAGLPRPPPGVNPKGSIDMGPPAPPAAPPLQGADGQQYQVDLMDPENPLKPAQAPGLQVAQREGALPPDVMQRQGAEMAAMQQQSLAAEQQSRADQARIMNDATLKAMAKNEADRIKQQQDIQEQQAKVERLDKERQQLASMEIDKSLSGAVGLVGGLMSVLGAALLGSTGSDAGLRMIESTIDRSVRNQVNQRDTKLGLLTEQVGSAQQAIKMGKAELYKLAADRAELLVQKTKNDVYEAQSPAIIQGLRQKQLEYTQKWEQDSLGKTIEKVPPPAKPPSPEALQKYGELRRERDAATGVVQRMEQATGLVWSPGKNGQPGHYANAQEVIKKGIPGTGELEQWIPTSVYSTLGQQDAYQIRGAKQAIAYAMVRQMQPTGIISDVDRKVGDIAATLDTEQGLVQTLERLRNGEDQQRANDAAQYTPQVVAEYERQYRAAGGREQTTTPAAIRPATLEEKRRAAETMGQPQQPQSMELQQMTPEQRMGALNESLTTIAQEKNIPPEGIAILMGQAGHETNDGKNMPTNNFFGMKSTERNRKGGAGMTNLMTTEGAGSSAKRVPQNFATFDSANDAAMDMLSLLERKYPRALEALQMGDADAYVAALKDGGYFTGNEGGYLQGILRRL
jgi:flagellum-specific peptidoglycan hydrolase FlgJ